MEKGSFLKHFLTLSIGTIINVIIGFITVPIITRLVNPSDYGSLSIFTLYADICVLIFTLGLDQSYIRFFYSEKSGTQKSSLLRKCFVIPTLAWVLVSAVFLFVYFLLDFDFKFSFIISAFLCGFVLIQIVTFGKFVPVEETVWIRGVAAP